MDLLSNRIITNKMKLKIKTNNDIPNPENKQFPFLRPSSSKNQLKKKSSSYQKPCLEKFEIKNKEKKIDYEKENIELKLKIEILQKELNKLKLENNDLKNKLEIEYIPKNKKKILLMSNQKIKFNSFNDYSSISTNITKIDSKNYSEKDRREIKKNSFENNMFNTIESNNNHRDIKFKLIKSRQILSLNKNTKSYCNINDVMKNLSKDPINKMELIRKRTLNLFENYNFLIQEYNNNK